MVKLRLWLLIILAAFLGRIVLTYRVFNDTTDEQMHIACGLEYLEKAVYRIEPQHPPLARLALAALPYYFAGMRALQGAGMWGNGAWGLYRLDYYWKTLSLARAGNLIFAVLLFYFVYRWSLLLHGSKAAVAACLLATCCPNLIAHASLATVDMAAAATILMAAFFLWQWCEQPGWRYCLASAAAFAVATLCKFSALAFLPPIAAAYFLTSRWGRWRAGQRPYLRHFGQGLLRAGAFCALAALIVWAGYKFDVGFAIPPGHHYHSTFNLGPPGSLPRLLLQSVGFRVMPAPRFWEGLIVVSSHNQEGHLAYLLGKRSMGGWWYYFPVAVGLKTTFPLLLLAASGVGLSLFRPAGRSRARLYPVWAAGVIMAVAMTSHINIGVRHALPIFPFFAILGAALFADAESRYRRRRLWQAAAMALLAWHVVESVAAHPDYLPYFNELARGREERFLADSNLDWGQDLARLARYTREHHITSIQLSYFGTSNAVRLGVPAKALPWFGHDSGWVAISVSHLVGLRVNPDYTRWYREQKPFARVGKSIWIFYLPPAGQAGAPAR
ncbi:MAG: glycosyltransferase family 39 protein [Acidobacteria bacterium]|nr:glycosyltransferase family 39 protein [Acidobacteriota bacterium]